MNTVDSTLEERGTRYGSYVDVSQTTADLFSILCERMEGRDDLHAYHIEALHMICNKMARAVCGDPMYADNWHDISGYARLVENEITKV
ncbi:hypothetical protein [Stenotrophomonas phage SOVA965]